MSKKAVIFDLDGTLMHTLPDIHTAICRMIEKLDYPENKYEDTLAGINKGTGYLVRHALPDGIEEEKFNEALKCYLECYSECYSESTEPFSGVCELVEKLYRAGYKLAVLSNKPDAFTKKLVEKGFPERFSPVVGQGKYAVKPSPEAPLAIADEIGVLPSDVVFVGDSDIDMKTAKAAGMYPLGVGWGYRPSELLIDAGAKSVAETPEKLFDMICGLN